MNCRISQLVLSIVFACVAMYPKAATCQTLTIQAFQAKVRQQQDVANSIWFTVSEKATFDDALLKKGLMKGRQIAFDGQIARLGAKRFASMTSRSFGVDDGMVKSTKVAVFDGSDMRIRRNDKLLTIQVDKSAYSELSNYFNALLWASTDAEEQHCKQEAAAAYFLPYFLDDKSYTVASTEEMINGHMCYLIQSKEARRRLWVARKLDWSLVRYEFDNPVPGDNQWRINYLNHKRLRPQVWMPFTVVVEHDMSATGSEEIAGTFTNTITVTKMTENVPASLFTLKPRVGDTVINTITNEVYDWVPTDDKTLDRTIGVAQRLIDADSSRSEKPAWLWIVIGVCLSIVGVFALFIVRMRKRT